MTHCSDRTKSFVVLAGLLWIVSGGIGTAHAVKLCHYPPGNPGNVQLINATSQAIPQHVAQHGDVVCGAGSSTCCVTPEHACTDLESDPNNCGSCGTVCSGGSTCEHGECVGEEEVACTGCDLDVPCGPLVGCGNNGNCWVKADRSGCFCGVFDSCSNHPPCDLDDSCPQGLTCIENCCGKLCYPPCGH
jgi:hypothetical protein